MKKNILFFIAIMLFTIAKVCAQDPGYNERAKKYIDQFYPLAIEEQKKSGIPASITLGQGILETEAGASELMTGANNHFGIKCNNNWLGPTFSHTDDAPDECFKKYKCAEESYRDHSLHLKTNKRYSPLFALSTTDYASWAICLKRCGYATNPHYAQQLIKIIEDFKLQEYTYAALDSTNSGNYPALPAASKKAKDIPLVINEEKEEETTALPAHAEVADNHKTTDNEPAAPTAKSYDDDKVEMINGMKAFYAYKGEQLVKYADQYHIRYSRLLEMNDFPDAPLPFDTYVYLEKKLTYGSHETHIVNSGETLLMISQTEGIQYKKLLALNQLNPNEEPITGTILELQKVATSKPHVRVNEIKAHSGNAIVSTPANDPAHGDGYIAINRTKPASGAKPHTVSDPADGFETTNWPETTPPPAKKKTVPAKAPVTASNQGDGFETTNWPETTPPPAKKKVTTAKAPATTDQGDGFETTNWPETTPSPAKKKVVTAKAPAETDQGGGFETTNWPEATPPPAKKPVAAITHEAAKTNDDDVSTDKPSIAKKDNADKKTTTKTQGAKQDDENDDDLSSLKADMDKVVYADNSKLVKEKSVKEKATKPEALPKEVVKEKAKPATSGGAKYYTIKKGETAFSIAKKNNLSVDELLKMNDIDAKGIKAGYKIQVKE